MQALLRIINVPRREIGATSIRHLADYARQRHRSLDVRDAANSGALNRSLGRRAAMRIEEFIDLIAELRRTQPTGPMPSHFAAPLLAVKSITAAWLADTSDLAETGGGGDGKTSRN